MKKPKTVRRASSTADKRPSRSQKPKPKTAGTIKPKDDLPGGNIPAEPRTIVMKGSVEMQKAMPSELLTHTMARLYGIMKRVDGEKSESGEDFARAALTGMNPTTTAEALLISQMIATHELALLMLARAKHSSLFPQSVESGNIAAKLLSVFERQFQTLARARKPQQVVEVVHTHKHLHMDGSTLPGAGVMTEIEGQAYGPNDPRTLALAPGPALLGQDAPADTLPVAGDTARPLPAARRRRRDRRT